jgi:hypothetical protein
MNKLVNRIDIEQLYSVPVNTGKREGTHREFSRLIRNESATIWAVGTNLVLSSHDGLNWRSSTKGLRQIAGSFAVDEIVCYRAQSHLILRAESGFHLYCFDRLDRKWQYVSGIPITFPAHIAVAANDKTGLLVLAEDGDKVFVHRSENGHAWQRFATNLRGTPIYFQLSPNGNGFCCLQHWRIGHRFVAAEGSSVHVTNDLGKSWRQVTSLSSDLFRATTIDHDAVLLGGTEGFFGVCDFRSCKPLIPEYPSEEVVGVDAYKGKVIAILESESLPLRHRLFLSSDFNNWAEFSLELDDRVSAAKFVDESRIALCTNNSLYACSLN